MAPRRPTSSSAAQLTSPVALAAPLDAAVGRPGGAGAGRVRRGPGAASIVVIVLLAAGYFIPRGPMWNADSRLFLTASIVDRGQLNIDPFGVDTGDVARANGHYYSDKAPGLSLLAVPAYAVIKFTLLRGQPYSTLFDVPVAQRLDFLPRYLLALLFSGLPTAVLVGMLYQFLGRFGISPGWQTLLSLTYGMGTMALPFASVFFGHQLAAALLFGAFVLLFRVRHGELSQRYIVLAGLLAGYSIVTEYPTALIVGALALYTLGPRPAQWADTLRLAVGAVPALTVAGVYNALAFGSPLSQGYAHLAGPVVFQRGQAQGFMGIGVPELTALWQVTLGPYRGIFELSPVLLLCIPALVLLVRNPAWRREAVLWLNIVLLYGLFTISYYAWDGGFSLGPRHFLPALPFLVLPLGALVCPGRSRTWRRITATLAGCSIAIVVLATATGPLMDPAYAAPLTQFVLPSLLGIAPDPTHPAALATLISTTLPQALPGLRSAILDNNWGMLLGLPGIWQLVPLCAAIGLVLLWRRWREWRVRGAS